MTTPGLQAKLHHAQRAIHSRRLVHAALARWTVVATRHTDAHTAEAHHRGALQRRTWRLWVQVARERAEAAAALRRARLERAWHAWYALGPEARRTGGLSRQPERGHIEWAGSANDKKTGGAESDSPPRHCMFGAAGKRRRRCASAACSWHALCKHISR